MRPIADPPGLPARRGAARLLDAVLHKGIPLDGALDGALRGIQRPDDRALARNLASSVLRWLPDLDGLIDGATQRPLPDDSRARMALRTGIAGHLLLGTPDHAVISTTLAQLEGGPRRLAHAVLSRLLREGIKLPEVPTLPGDFHRRWAEAWGEDVADAAARGLAQEPPVDLTLRDPATTDEWAETLGGVSLFPGHIRLARGIAVPQLPGFTEGAWWVQDLAASLPARLLNVQEHDAVLDLCAAPGGKTMQLSAAGGEVLSVDMAPLRLERVRENLTRTKLRADTVAADALKWAPKRQFDRILLDAPCSATGIFRRHPDVLHVKAARDLAPVVALQAALLDRAVAWLKPGGTLVFSTCSLERAEGEDQLAGLLARNPGVALQPVEAGELPDGFAATDGAVRVLPGTVETRGGCDGFFVARLKKA
ncbi:RsmB/NOP family class I SAM-dependent RNA methyltransferase [Glacieibacterium sp.]|uniref:RsmB/NOP family class I SAM-dependent RNA methyltransferase n=1 Tax=Glacieibacterium sp. TaxID=2860237 RepID=UPI003B009410